MLWACTAPPDFTPADTTTNRKLIAPSGCVDLYLGLGSNLNRRANIRAAMSELEALFGQVECSRIYKNEAAGMKARCFFNLVIRVQCSCSLSVVIDVMRKIEDKMGRDRTRPGQVPIDIDVLLYGRWVGQFRSLELPRHDILTRAYVLKPLAQLAPRLCHPVIGRGYSDLWEQFQAAHPQLPGLYEVHV